MDRNALRDSLRELLEQETWEKYENLDESTSLREGLNLDSIDMVSVVLQIQNQFQIDISSNELEGLQKVGQLLDLIEAKLAAKGDAPRSSKAA